MIDVTTENRVKPDWGRIMGAGLLGVGLLVFSPACATTSPAPLQPSSEEPQDKLIQITDEDFVFPQALAHFSEGYRLELNQQFDEALTAYRAALAADPEYRELYLRVALNLIRRNQTDDAIGILKELVERDPKDPQPYLWLASAYRHARQPEQALEAFRDALALDPKDDGIYIQYADLLIQGGEEEQAVTLLQEGVRKAKEPGNLYRILAELFVRRASLSADGEKSLQFFHQSIDYFKAALKTQPDEATLLYALGDLHLRMRLYKEAVQYLEHVTHLQPDNLVAKEKLLMAYDALGERDQAIRLLEDMSRLQPTNSRILFSLGSIYEQQGEREKALANYRMAASGDQADVGVYIKLAHLQMEAHPDRALKALEEGLVRFPLHPRLLEMQGYIYVDQADYEKALAALLDADVALSAANETPMSANFHLYIALCHYFLGDAEQMTERLEQAIEIQPDLIDLFVHLVMKDDDPDRPALAVKALATLEERMPTNPALPIARAYLHSFRKEYGPALEAFAVGQKIAEETGQAERILDARFYFWYAAAQERNGDLDQAETLFRRSMELDPEYADTYNYMAYMWADKSIKLDEAIVLVEKALALSPDSPAYLDTRGWIYFRMGRIDDAYRDLTRANELMPDEPTLMEHLGDVYFERGNTDRAAELWNRALELDAENKDLAAKLEQHGLRNQEE